MKRDDLVKFFRTLYSSEIRGWLPVGAWTQDTVVSHLVWGCTGRETRADSGWSTQPQSWRSGGLKSRIFHHDGRFWSACCYLLSCTANKNLYLDQSFESRQAPSIKKMQTYIWVFTKENVPQCQCVIPMHFSGGISDQKCTISSVSKLFVDLLPAAGRESNFNKKH